MSRTPLRRLMLAGALAVAAIGLGGCYAYPVGYAGYDTYGYDDYAYAAPGGYYGGYPRAYAHPRGYSGYNSYPRYYRSPRAYAYPRYGYAYPRYGYRGYGGYGGYGDWDRGSRR
ncbi:MAG: hypothetical protein JF625_13120 [Inquilinus limosus]|uniref:Lipoprotein n=1 Tax=Inquilinus limosus TaxID=171674 RepID=A0A952KE78_9PROT|nr:hypothetical protein [Inquilinus limosus]